MSAEKRQELYPEYSRVNWCSWCGSIIRDSSRQTCSDECFHQVKSKKQSDRLKNDIAYRRKLGTGRRSFMESSFAQWVKTNFPSVEFHQQHPFKNERGTGYYYADFYFPVKNLIIELDGTHHNHPDQIIHDERRDKHIKSLGVSIVRITASEYRKQSRINEVIELVSPA